MFKQIGRAAERARSDSSGSQCPLRADAGGFMRAILMHSDGEAARKPDPRSVLGDAAESGLDRLRRLKSEQVAEGKDPNEEASEPGGARAEAARSDGALPWRAQRSGRKKTSARNARYLEDSDDLIETPQAHWPSLEQLWPTLPPDLQGWIEALRLDIAELREGRIREEDMSTRLLLHGPPGTGKSFIARAFARSFDIPLISTSYARWGAYKDGNLDDVTFAMKRDFYLAAHFGPSVLFIDEIDTIPSRDSLSNHNRDYWVAFTNALLEELSGSDGRASNFILLAATNRRDALDPALLRNGRLEKQIALGAPTTAEACLAMLRVHLRDELADAPLGRIACCLVGKPAADIEALTRRARHAARAARTPLSLDHLFKAAEMDAQARDPATDRTIALHEAGHAFAHVVMGLADRVSCSMSGVTAAEGRRTLITRATVDKRLVALLAGRAAEEAIVGDISSGAGGHDESDLGKAHELASEAILSFGFSRAAPLHFTPRAERRAFPLMSREREEIRAMVETAYRRALALMRANRATVVALADALQSRRALENAEIRAIVAGHLGEGGKPRFRIRASNEESFSGAEP